MLVRKTTILFTFLLVGLFNVTCAQVTNYVFTAGTETYTSINGTVPVLNGNGADPTADEGYVNNIPLGFTFRYLGKDYTAISISSNGFASFKPITTPGFSNNISNGGSARPILAPFWEDIALASTNDLQYGLTGNAGSRVFVVQWGNTLVDFGSSAPSMSFQLQLHEGTNIIDFIYNRLPNTEQDFSGGASIGITGEATGNGNYLSLNNSSGAPVASSTIATNSITARPASGQLYRFTPPACPAPGNLSVTNITSTSATFNWLNDAGGSGYQYTITTNPVGPGGGTNGGGGSPLPITGLAPGTQYYLHVRTNCSGTFSGWSTFGFTTLCNTVTPPYTMPISNVIAPALPLCTSVKDDNQDGYTWRSYSSAGAGWTNQVVAYVYNPNSTTPANDWLFTAGLNLTGGASYRLKFKYNNDRTSLYPEKLKVAYGTGTSPADMTNILGNYPVVSNPTPKTAIIDFTPATSGIYYIGFQAYSDADKNVLILDDISIDLRPGCDVPTALKAVVQSSSVSANISWTAPEIGAPSGYDYAVNTTATPPGAGTFIANPGTSVNGLTPNTQYYLHVRTKCGTPSSDWVTLPFATLPNDEPCGAIALTRGGPSVCGNTTLATSVQDPFSNCSNPNNSVWYKYTPAEDGTIVLRVTTPAAPARPLKGWVGWYQHTGVCGDHSFVNAGFCGGFGDNGNNDSDDIVSPYLTAGVTYYIMIDGFSDDFGEFCLSIPPCPPAVSVNVVDVLSTSANVTWAGSGPFIIEYGPVGFIPGTGATAGTNGTIIYPSTSPKMITGLQPLTSYDVYLRQNCSASGSGFSNNSAVKRFTTLGTPPPNDDCSGAVTIPVYELTCGGGTAGSTLNATPSPVFPLPTCGNGAQGYDDDVWFKFIPSAGQFGVNIEIIHTGGEFDLVAQIYTSSDNSCTGTFTLYQCSDADGPGDVPIFNSMPVIPGKTYYIRIFSYDKAVNSQFTVCVSSILTTNDNAPGATSLTVGAPCTGALYSNENATQTAGEPTGSCSSLTGYATVWFKFVAPSGGAVRISTATGTGNTLTNSRVALFAAQDVNNYSTFNIISCDEDGGSGAFGEMSVLYATGLIPGTTYYVQVDKYNNTVSAGKFCITVDIFTPAMISTNANCSSPVQVPAGSIPTYAGWVPLMDESSRLIALVRNTAGGSPNAYNIAQTLNAGPVRKDAVSGEYYLNRNYLITNSTTGNANVNVQLFFTLAELSTLQTVDPAANISRLRITRQSGSACQSDFVAGNGTNVEILQSNAGTQNGVGWVQFITTSFSNFYLHSTRSELNAKIFLQGAFNAATGRHKDVTTTWANVMNTSGRNQPYSPQPFGYTVGTESVPAGFFKSTAATTDVIDWVFLETKNLSGTVMSRNVAFVREDGQLVAIDGVSPAPLSGLVTGNYYVTVMHRNHLGISTEGTLPFTVKSLGVPSPIPPVFDFTTADETSIFGNALAYRVVNGKNVMIGGNANSNNNVRYGGLSNDAGAILAYLLGVPSAVTVNVYSANDVNLDGTVKYGGLNNDTGFFLSNVLGGLPTQIVTEQKR